MQEQNLTKVLHELNEKSDIYTSWLYLNVAILYEPVFRRSWKTAEQETRVLVGG
jgi:hypothetical protein